MAACWHGVAAEWAARHHGTVPAEPTLDPADVEAEPTVQFQRWFAEAVAAGVPEPEAMCLASVDTDGWPAARMVLMKHVDHRGFVFYTNYKSDKGRQLGACSRAALLWRWFILERQVRVVGTSERATEAESDAYFASRPRGSQIGAWASPQSRVLANRAVLERLVDDVVSRFGDGPLPRPPWWGGIRVVPQSVEFWQGRPDRLHDRVRYRRAEPSGWIIERLAP
ncbi:MAG: pyridoxamine 5'-phosphate oxidase [Acidimicrobiales bacterium]